MRTNENSGLNRTTEFDEERDDGMADKMAVGGRERERERERERKGEKDLSMPKLRRTWWKGVERSRKKIAG